MIRKNKIPILLFFCIIIVFTGCVRSTMTAKVGNEIDKNALKEIIVGKTTRSDVFALLGTPHSIIETQSEFTEGYSTMGFSTVQNRYLSSLDDKHYAMLYRFSKVSSKSNQGYALLVIFIDTQITVSSDELFLLFNKETDILDDVAYPK